MDGRDGFDTIWGGRGSMQGRHESGRDPMRLPRFSIGRLMIVVGLIALNLSAVRAFVSIEPWLLIGVAPAGLALQLAAFRLIRSRGRARAFWAGFLAAG